MNAKLHLMYSYPSTYGFVGYVDYNAFIMKIDKTTNEIKEFKYQGGIQHLNMQDYIYECCMYTIANNLMNAQIKAEALPPYVPNNPIETSEEDMISAILKRNQSAVDQIRSDMQEK